MSDSGTPATPEEIAENTFFQGLYAAWLQARAVNQDPSQDESTEASNASADAVDEAAAKPNAIACSPVQPMTSSVKPWWLMSNDGCSRRKRPVDRQPRRRLG